MESVVGPEFVEGKPLAWGLQMAPVPPGDELEAPLRVCTVAAAMALPLVVPLCTGNDEGRWHTPVHLEQEEGGHRAGDDLGASAPTPFGHTLLGLSAAPRFRRGGVPSLSGSERLRRGLALGVGPEAHN